MASVDFAAVRRAIPIARVLELLRFEPSIRRGDQLRGPCPLHGSKRPESGSFSVNLTKNAFRCFVCGAAGNQLDLWRLATQLPLREATVDLASRLDLPLPPHTSTVKPAADAEQRRGTRRPQVP